jgi:hypothetical protein
VLTSGSKRGKGVPAAHYLLVFAEVGLHFDLGAKIMLKPDNQKDKARFEGLKKTQVERGRDKDQATEIAASEVKEMRKREGRAKEDSTAGT